MAPFALSDGGEKAGIGRQFQGRRLVVFQQRRDELSGWPRALSALAPTRPANVNPMHVMRRTPLPRQRRAPPLSGHYCSVEKEVGKGEPSLCGITVETTRDDRDREVEDESEPSLGWTLDGRCGGDSDCELNEVAP